MEDISPELLEEVRKAFRENIENDDTIRKLHELIENGNATYADAEQYALAVADALSQAFANVLSDDVLPNGKMYFNIAEKVIGPLIQDDYDLIADAARKVQEALNKKAGLGIKAQVAELDEERVFALIDRAANAESTEEVLYILDEPIKNLSLFFVTETLRQNVEFQSRAGLSPTVIRKSEGKSCKWCRGLAGKYEYPDMPRDVWRRHQRCRCTVIYDPGDGKRVNVHTKQLVTTKDEAKAESRKFLGMKANGVQIRSASKHVIERLSSASVTSERIIDALRNPLHVRSATLSDGSTVTEIIGKGATLHMDASSGTLLNAYQTHSETVKRYRRKGKK